VRFSERLYHIKHDLYEVVKCEKCNVKPAIFGTYNTGYRYCSQMCNSSGPNIELAINLRIKGLPIWKDRLKLANVKMLSTDKSFIQTGKMKLECLVCGNKYSRTTSYANTCPRCSKKGTSKMEKELLEHVRSMYNGEIIPNCKKVIRNHWSNRALELDIWLPEIRVAIEFNGSFWHKNLERQLYDKLKEVDCIANNIDLIVIKEKDWVNDKVQCLNFIKNVLNQHVV
jgi:hypothetical protein